MKLVARVLFYDALVFEGGGAEVEEDGEFEAGGGEVVDGLGFMAGVEVGDSFEFEDDFAFDEEVGFVVADQFAFVGDGEFDELFEGDAAESEFVGEGGLIDCFEEARAEDAVDFHTGADYGVGEFFEEEFWHDVTLSFLPRITRIGA